MKGDGPVRALAVSPAQDPRARSVEDRFMEEYAQRLTSPLVVVMAAYNEEGAIGDVLRQMPAELCGLATDVLVVVDGSTDRTAEIARAAGVMVCDLPVNRGQGVALRTGYRLAELRGARYVATIDADGQYDPADLATVVAPLVTGDADFVTGSRRLGDAHGGDRLRRAGVVVFGAVITLLTGRRITDPANGLRAMRVEVTSSVSLHQRQYQAAELLVGALRHGFRVAEVPTTMYPRAAGVTKKGGNLRYGLRFAGVVASTWWRTVGRRGGRSTNTTSSYSKNLATKSTPYTER